MNRVYKDTLISTIVDAGREFDVEYVVYKDTLISTIVDIVHSHCFYLVYKDTLISTIVDWSSMEIGIAGL